MGSVPDDHAIIKPFRRHRKPEDRVRVGLSLGAQPEVVVLQFTVGNLMHEKATP
jgi:hypothetical protein